MKQKDIAMIVLVGGIAAFASFLISNSLFGTATRKEKTEVVQSITSDFTLPEQQYFNKNSLNPTKVITIGQNNNANPFNGVGR